MSSIDIVNFDSTDDLKIHTKTVKSESDLIETSLLLEYNTDGTNRQKSRRPDSEDNRSLSTGQSGTSVLDQEQSPVDDPSLCSTSPICAAPLVRQFWKAGNYNDVLTTPKSSCKNGSTYLHIHPKFLHSNATSHKWAFGAIAELVDNAIDEIQNGATFVLIDKVINPRNGSPAFLIQDDGGGMDPDAMRRCLSFGFSDKKSNLAIGQYGNGFKTSSMRLGADVIVFSRNMVNRTLTQSIGLLSYTFLTQTGHDRIVVPMVKDAMKYLKVMADMGHFPDAITYTSLMNGMCRKGNALRALALLEEMEGKGCIPNSCTYNTLLNGLCKSRYLDKGVELYEVMKAGEMKLESGSYATFLRALCRNGRVAEAYEVFDYAVESKSLTDVSAYSTLEVSLKWLKKAKEQGLAV